MTRVEGAPARVPRRENRQRVFTGKQKGTRSPGLALPRARNPKWSVFASA